jgi:hypothetical protein
MDVLTYDEVTATPETAGVWAVTFSTSTHLLGWVIQSGIFFKAVSSDQGDLGQQMTLKRAAHLVAVS